MSIKSTDEKKREAALAMTRAWNAVNKDRKKAYARAYYEANREKTAAKVRAWKAANGPRVKELARRKVLKRYGLTEAEFDAMFLAQHGACAICSVAFAARSKIHVDHDHRRGQVRALLCIRCNVGLGFVERDAGQWIRLAIEYLGGFEPKRGVA